MEFPKMDERQLLQRLQPPTGKVKAVLDTDTFNEIDDQFAVVYTLLSEERIDLQALYAAPFYNENSEGPKDGMEKSYDEIIRILDRMNVPSEGFVFKGADHYLPSADQPAASDAAADLVRRAMAMDDDEPLYVMAIGAITNVASAILMEPRIIDKIVVVWLGGHALHWNDTREFNLAQDILASRIMFDSGVPLVLIPCQGVASHLITTLPEVEQYVEGKGAIGDFLAERFRGCSPDHYAYSRVIWDISAVAYLIHPGSVPTDLVHSPVLTDQVTWSVNTSRHWIRCARFVYRDWVFRDMFHKIEQFAANDAERKE